MSRKCVPCREMEAPAIGSHFEDLKDPRVERTRRHRLMDIIIISVLAVVAGADGWSDIVQFAEDRSDVTAAAAVAASACSSSGCLLQRPLRRRLAQVANSPRIRCGCPGLSAHVVDAPTTRCRKTHLLRPSRTRTQPSPRRTPHHVRHLSQNSPTTCLPTECAASAPCAPK